MTIAPELSIYILIYIYIFTNIYSNLLQCTGPSIILVPNERFSCDIYMRSLFTDHKWRAYILQHDTIRPVRRIVVSTVNTIPTGSNTMLVSSY